MTTFDQILPELVKIFQQQEERVQRIAPVVVNRDLNCRVRLIVAEHCQDDPNAQAALATITDAICAALGPHAFPPERAVLFEPDMDAALKGVTAFPLENIVGVSVVDRLATEGSWSSIFPATLGAPRIVFFSIKGGVGRSTALAASAWALAESGKRVLVLDLDLESPGVERRAKVGHLRG
jgi:Mrp family chromosome partitioning ATPase